MQGGHAVEEDHGSREEGLACSCSGQPGWQGTGGSGTGSADTCMSKIDSAARARYRLY